MITQTHPVNITDVPWLLPEDLSPDTSVFFDIETTGFRPASSHLYMIGVLFRSSDGWKTTQWMSERSSEEAALLRIFAAFLRPYRALVHFNGERFDLPYLREKYSQYQIEDPLSSLRSFDLYRAIRTIRPLLGLDHINQKSLESFLGIVREDPFDGGALIQVYRSYCKEKDDLRLKQLTDHNREDLTGMLSLLPLLTYMPLAELCASSPAEATDPFFGCAGAEPAELTWSITDDAFQIRIRLAHRVPVHIFRQGALGTLRVEECTAVLEVPIHTDRMRYFFDNPRDYYYLPLEDQAIHKSVAQYVDLDHRVKATRENCYIPKEGRFLPQLPGGGFTPSYRRVWNDPIHFFELPAELTVPDEPAGETAQLFVRQYASMLLREFLGR